MPSTLTGLLTKLCHQTIQRKAIMTVDFFFFSCSFCVSSDKAIMFYLVLVELFVNLSHGLVEPGKTRSYHFLFLAVLEKKRKTKNLKVHCTIILVHTCSHDKRLGAEESCYFTLRRV